MLNVLVVFIFSKIEKMQKNINKNVMKAYYEALNYITNRIKNYCHSRNANYLLVPSDMAISEIFLRLLPEMGVLK